MIILLVSTKVISKSLGIFFHNDYHILPHEKMYWENVPDTGTTLVNRAMSRKRYSDTKRYLHLNDNLALNKEDCYYKIALKQFGIFSENLTISERMVRYFGRHSCKMYMKNKPVKFGYKLWMLTSSNGYPFHYKVSTSY
ncbi:hypothetical protein AVEN_164603-1 [Araneus ventricosus]|uniref:PiggyBac transposable element-derived protein domain-containing protein n=1 Tax=Araneus ventricosus TaxID=182803 RepID=A0A4Y2B3R1_ARAVE|nr:hypothetical protein AVEN_164603-1 [Araneus ventricosus]